MTISPEISPLSSFSGELSSNATEDVNPKHHSKTIPNTNSSTWVDSFILFSREDKRLMLYESKVERFCWNGQNFRALKTIYRFKRRRPVSLYNVVSRFLLHSLFSEHKSDTLTYLLCLHHIGHLCHPTFPLGHY